MNGRVYDYNVGRFLSVDPVIQAPSNTQSVNPYSYIMNNPLAGTDPSGYSSHCDTLVVCSRDEQWQDEQRVRNGGKTGIQGVLENNGANQKLNQITKSAESSNPESIGSQTNTAQNEKFGNIFISRDAWKDYVDGKGNVRTAVDESVLSFFNISPENRPDNFEEVFANWSKFNQAIQVTDSKFAQLAGVGTALFSRVKTPKSGGGYGQSRKFWQDPIQHSNKWGSNKVYQRNDLINPSKVDKIGRTNLERMREGIAPEGADGFSINLHHMTQRHNGSLAEMTQRFHQSQPNKHIIHINLPTIPSGINRPVFDNWKYHYWKQRALDFE